MQRFSERLEPYLHGISARCRRSLKTNVSEGISNTIKPIKHRAYGSRDQEYFFLKIRAAVPELRMNFFCLQPVGAPPPLR